jgi:hypothetical protein
MEVLNNENDLILTFRENKKASLLLDVESATWLVETKLDDFVKNKLSGENEMQLLNSEEKESWSDMAARIKEEVAGLIEVEDSRNALVKEGNELEKCLGQLRAKFLSEQNVSVPIIQYSNILHQLSCSHIFISIYRTLVKWKLTTSKPNGNNNTMAVHSKKKQVKAAWSTMVKSL